MKAVFLSLLYLGLAASAAAQDLSVPKKYQSLYRNLDGQISAFGASLPRLQGEPPLLRGATLTFSGCDPSPAAIADAAWRKAMAELDALGRAGAQVIVMDVCYPLLTPAFDDPRLRLEQLANLANEVRLRGMRLLVHHNALPTANAAMQATRYYRGMTKQRFFAERTEEAKSVVLAMHPDWLTLASDPQNDGAGMDMTPRDWRRYVERASGELHQQLGELVPPLGAGAGLWDEWRTIETLASLQALAYIDLRFYPLTAGKESTLDRLVSWPWRIHAIDPSKRIMLTAAWMPKPSPKESGLAAPTPDMRAREVFGFWSPLDVKFLRILARAAREGGIELLAVSRSRYLFAYLDFFDPQNYRATARTLDALSAQRAAAAMQRGELTDTGRAFGAL